MATVKFDAPTDLLHYQLRTALTMEHDSLAALGELATAAKSAEIKKMFRHHADETKEQIENLHKVFELMGWKGTTAPSAATKGIGKQAGAMIERSGPKMVDRVVLAAALGNEHYEISAYQALLVPVQAMDNKDAQALLLFNLDQETHTSEELHTTLVKISGAD
jgi:ferritin-like metal-binding protein YciE